MAAELLVRLNKESLSHALQISEELNISIEEAISVSLQNQINKKENKREQSSLMGIALHNAFMRNEGDEFSLMDLLDDLWQEVESPRSFGRHFRKSLEESGIGVLERKTIDNKAIYKRTDCKAEPQLI